MNTWSALLAVVSLIVLVGGAVAVLVVVLVRRRDRGLGHPGAVAAPGQRERNAEAGRLVVELDDAASGARTSLDFARLQLGSDAPAELAAAAEEARQSAAALAATLAATHDGEAQGPAGTQVAGRLTAALARADAARARLAAAEARVAHETRGLDPR